MTHDSFRYVSIEALSAEFVSDRTLISEGPIPRSLMPAFQTARAKSLPIPLAVGVGARTGARLEARSWAGPDVPI